MVVFYAWHHTTFSHDEQSVHHSKIRQVVLNLQSFVLHLLEVKVVLDKGNYYQSPKLQLLQHLCSHLIKIWVLCSLSALIKYHKVISVPLPTSFPIPSDSLHSMAPATLAILLQLMIKHALPDPL